MWSTSARSPLLCALVALAAAGCDRRLDLALALATDSCTAPVPAGGSIYYELSAVSGGARTVCGGCLPVSATLDGAEAIANFLRANAPLCTGVKPGAAMVVKLTAWSAGSCPEAPAPRLFCSESQPVTLPDGRDDAVVVAVLTCNIMCTAVCKPTSCAALGKNCGSISDGCGAMLACGDCKPPEKCGGAGVPNVCGK